MVRRRDLVDHLEWLAGSEYYEEVIDEALVAIALAAHGYGSELVEYGAAWMMASGVVEVLDLERLVEQARTDRRTWLAAEPDAAR